MEPTYRCSRCGKELPVSEFSADRSHRSGHRSQCKSCVKNRPGRAEYMKQYREEHRDYFREKHAEYRERNREKLRLASYERYHSEKGRAYRDANREHLLAVSRAYYAAHSEQSRARAKVYRASDRGRAAHQFDKVKRRACIETGDRDISLRAVFDRAGGRCRLCGGLCDYTDYEVKGNAFIAGNLYPSIDHIIPLKHGGTHTWDNVQLAHRRCNSSKRDSINY